MFILQNRYKGNTFRAYTQIISIKNTVFRKKRQILHMHICINQIIVVPLRSFFKYNHNETENLLYRSTGLCTHCLC